MTVPGVTSPRKARVQLLGIGVHVIILVDLVTVPLVPFEGPRVSHQAGVLGESGYEDW
jgi:hypothetical protein